jgi:RinA family phage transcriptional activator
LEWEVRFYHDTKQELEAERDSIILAGKPVADGMPRGGEVSDSTARTAEKLLNSIEIREMERKIKAIDRAMDEWTARDPVIRTEYIRQKFWINRLTPAGIAQKLNIAEVTTWHWRRGFLTLVGKYLGWRV